MQICVRNVNFKFESMLVLWLLSCRTNISFISKAILQYYKEFIPCNSINFTSYFQFYPLFFGYLFRCRNEVTLRHCTTTAVVKEALKIIIIVFIFFKCGKLSTWEGGEYWAHYINTVLKTAAWFQSCWQSRAKCRALLAEFARKLH